MAQGILGTISPQGQGTSTQQVSLGTRYEDAFGRTYHYAYAAAAVARGKIGVAAAVVAAHDNMNFAVAPAVGDKIVKVTLDSGAVTADQYKDGWLVVQDGTGEGRAYKVEGNDAQTSTTGTAVVYLAEAIDTAGALSEANVDLIYNKYDNIRVADTNQTFIPVGVPNGVGGLGASEYGYIQTWGPCAVYQDEATAALGEDMTLGAGTGAGQVEGKDGAAEPFVGTSGPAASVADEYQLIYLKLDR